LFCSTWAYRDLNHTIRAICCLQFVVAEFLFLKSTLLGRSMGPVSQPKETSHVRALVG
jgi:hypothetical protein